METHKNSNRIRLWERLKRAFATHSMTVELIAMSIGIGTILSLSDTAPEQAHFLLKAPIIRQTASASSQSIQPKSITKRDLRLEERKRQALVRAKTTVALQKPYLALNDLRPAAMEEPESGSSSSPATPPFSRSAAKSSTPVLTIRQQADVISFPVFDHSVHPFTATPNWGAMTSPAEWNRTYRQMNDADFVRIPAYDLRMLTTPSKSLIKDRYDAETIKILTAKLYYSTRFFGAYNLDATEFTAVHPGIDLKLAADTPIGAVAGGRVHAVRHDEQSLGLHVIIEHHAPDGQTYYSIYGHMETATVKIGDAVTPGMKIGTVGLSGHTTGPHVHLQVDRGEPNETYHEVYWPSVVPTPEEADIHTVNPITFIRQFADGN